MRQGCWVVPGVQGQCKESDGSPKLREAVAARAVLVGGCWNFPITIDATCKEVESVLPREGFHFQLFPIWPPFSFH